MHYTLDPGDFYKQNLKEIKRRIYLKTHITENQKLEDKTHDFILFIIEHDMLSKFDSTKASWSTYIDLCIQWSFGWTKQQEHFSQQDNMDHIPATDLQELQHRINEFSCYLKKHDQQHLTKLLEVLRTRIEGKTCPQDSTNQLFRYHIRNFKRKEDGMDEQNIEGQHFIDDLENLIAIAMGLKEGIYTLITIDPKTKKINVRLGNELTNWSYQEQQTLRLRIKGRSK